MVAIEKAINGLLNLKGKMPLIAGNEAVEFYRGSFTNGVEGFRNVTLQKWEKSRKGRGTTMVQSGNLRDSIRILRLTQSTVKGGSTFIYAKIHNEGRIIIVTPKMRSFFWAKYAQSKGKTKTRAGRESRSERANTANAEAQKWKALALSNRITMPKRQFLGRSIALEKQIAQAWLNELLRLF